ncbi:MAG: DNA internalization-related competence protein ComEC/Rec2 [Cycloclasticus sp.]
MNDFQKMTVFFSAGILSIQLLNILPEVSHLIMTTVFSIVVFNWSRGLSFFLLGFVWAAAYATSTENAQLTKTVEGKEVLIQGQIIELPNKELRSTQFLFSVERVLTPLNKQVFPNKIRLSWYAKARDLKAGERWQFLVKLKRPHGLANPHGFDYERWLFQQKIGATGYIRESSHNKRIDKASPWSVGYWRESLKNYLENSLPNSAHIGVIKALVLGDRSDISARQWDVFRQTGTSHLIAISGLHIGLISALVFGFVRWFALRFAPFSRRATQYALAASFLAAALYAALAGFSVPTQRALIMLSVVLAGVYWQRYYKPFHVISAALLAVLIYDPLAPMSAGFWLSFAAVAVILYGLVGRFGRPNFIRQLIQIQCFVAIGLMPVVLYFFQQVSLVSPLANILAVPWVSFVIVPLLLIALAVGAFSQSLGVNALELVNTLIDYLWLFLQALADIEFSQLLLPSVSIWASVIAMLGVALLLLPKGFIPKPMAWVLFVPLIFPLKTASLENAEFKLVLLDVGQGLSAVIHTASHTLVFDTGAKYTSKSDLASTVVIPYLRGEGVEELDALVVSHADNDHAGGANTLLDEMGVNKLLTSVPGIFDDKAATVCEQGLKWQWDGVEFEFLHPARVNLFKGNDASCVLKVSSSNGSVLLPGDIEKTSERSLLQYLPDKLEADVLIAPHHGSKTSSTRRFVEAVSPNYVLFAVGYRNRFGFPKQEIVKRYAEKGVKSFDTAKHGALTITFTSKQPISVSSYRAGQSKFWNWVP